MNAIKHGLSAQRVLLPDESPEDFDRFALALAEDVQPTGAVEQVLLERLTVAAWRLRRASRIEAEVLADERRESDGSTTSLGLGFVRAVSHGETLNVLARHERALERGLFAALHELDRTSGKPASNDAIDNGHDCGQPSAEDARKTECSGSFCRTALPAAGSGTASITSHSTSGRA